MFLNYAGLKKCTITSVQEILNAFRRVLKYIYAGNIHAMVLWTL